MPKYRFLHDFRGTINGSTERHLMGDEVELDYTLDALEARGEVERLDNQPPAAEPAPSEETVVYDLPEDASVDEVDEPAEHLVRRKASKKKG